jgi:hypothetical protein
VYDRLRILETLKDGQRQVEKRKRMKKKRRMKALQQ